MPHCAVKWCGKSSKSSSNTKDGISFHRFPKNPEIKEKWIDATQRDNNWYPSDVSVICSRHFTPDWFDMSKKKRRLLSIAVPTLFLPILVSPNYTSGMGNSCPSESGLIKQNIQPINDHGVTSHENPATSSTQKTSSSHIKEEPGGNIFNDSSPTSIPPIEEKALCRRVSDLTERLRLTKIHVKKLQDMNRLLKRKVSTLTKSLENLKNKGSITQENINMERLQFSNRQLRKKVEMLKRLLNEQKKNTYAKRNVVWCQSTENVQELQEIESDTS